MSKKRKLNSKFWAIALSLVLALSALPAAASATFTANASTGDDVVAVAEADVEGETEEEPEAETEAETKEDPEEGSKSLVGTITSYTGGAVIEGSTVTYGGPAKWSPKDPSVGRNVDGWWFGIRVNAPEGADLENATYVRADGGKRNFAQCKDGEDWIQLWFSTTEADVRFSGASSYTWDFDWDNNGESDQVVEIVVSETSTFDTSNLTAVGMAQSEWGESAINSGYQSLDAAVANCNDDYIKLLKDAELATVPDVDIVIPDGVTLTVDSSVYEDAKDYLTAEGTGKIVVDGTEMYTVSVLNGTGGGSHAKGDIVTISTDPEYYADSGLSFKGWKVLDGDAVLADASATTTTFTMTESNQRILAVYDYTVIEGENGTYSGEGTYTIRVSIPYDEFACIFMDDDENPLDEANYTATEGSTIITFTEAYMKSLPAGTHTVTILTVYFDGVSTTLTIPGASTGDGTTPNTGDGSPIVPFAVAALISGVAAAGVVVKKKLFA